jgi:hypothetical protein
VGVGGGGVRTEGNPIGEVDEVRSVNVDSTELLCSARSSSTISKKIYYIKLIRISM